MSIKSIRLTNLRHLVKEFGTIAAVANLSDTSENYLTQVLNEHKLPSGNTRGIGNAVAQKLEHGCGKYPDWMDTNHSQAVPQPDNGEPLTPQERELVALFRRADSPLREAILTTARLAK